MKPALTGVDDGLGFFLLLYFCGLELVPTGSTDL